ncbi:MAG: alpha-L-fucosidase [Planctomycetota bacterium]
MMTKPIPRRLWSHWQWLVVMAMTGLSTMAAGQAHPLADETPAQREARLQWWREARFGLFIHWGPVSLKGTEIGWSRGGERRGYGSAGTEIPVEVYDKLYKEFNPTRFDAREWVAIAKAAGMKYMVFTSRHHDGFSMFDTQASDHKITNPQSPYRRDVVKQLADACQEAGLRFGLYYSQPDWHHPDAFTDRHDRYLEYLRAQVRELLTNYGPLDVLWFDGLGKSATDYGAEALNRMVRELAPSILINNRNGLPEDFDTPEQVIGKFQNTRPWESCITICEQWAWKPNDRLKSLAECLQTLVRCAGGDGNLLLNVGPMPDGRIEPRQVERLQEIGAWLERYGTSIYATRGGPFKPGKWGASTYRGNTIYLHLFGPRTSPLMLPAIGTPVIGCSVLTGGDAQVQQTSDGITVLVPQAHVQPTDTIVVLELGGPAGGIAPIALPSLSLAAGKPARASNVFQDHELYAAAKAVDDDAETRWATDGGTKTAWLEVDLGQPTTVGRAAIAEAYAGRVRRFELQFKDGDNWQTALAGTAIGEHFAASFAPITARWVRLNILQATEGPTVWEFQLFPPEK